MVNYMGPGGGMAIPPYLQGRTPIDGGTRPMITPKQSIVPGETKPQFPQMRPGMPTGPSALSQTGQSYAANGMITPRNQPMLPRATQPPPGVSVQGGNIASPGGPAKPTSQTLYDFLKGDLEDQRRSGMANAVSDASARGVYYGTPLTTSQGDIETQYLRGLGQLQSGVLQNEQQNELSRLGIAGNLLNGAGTAQGGSIDPATMQMIGSIFGQSNAASGQRAGPAMSAPAPTMAPNSGIQLRLPTAKTAGRALV